MFAQLQSSSIKKLDLMKFQRKSVDLGSHSAKSNKYVSASKSNKAFEDSLRKSDSINTKKQINKSPLKQQLTFTKTEQEKSKENKPTFMIDITKKIKKVQSPFNCDPFNHEANQKPEYIETRMIVSSFDAISQKIDDHGQSSISLEKINTYEQQMDFKNLALQIKQRVNNFEIQNSKISQNLCVSSDMVLEDSSVQNSVNISLKSKSSETVRLRKKEKKIQKKREKQLKAKKLKEKVNSITEFVDGLHRKESHTKRKELIEELNLHLCEEKLTRLRNELKKLI